MNAFQLCLNKDTTKEITSLHSSKPSGDGSVRLLGFQLKNTYYRKQTKSRYTIRKIRNVVSTVVLKIAYLGLFQCHIQYGVNLWGYTTAATEVFRYQKKLLRDMIGANPKDHAKLLFLNWGF